MSGALGVFVAIAIGAVVGVLAHEFAHYAVLRLGGFEPRLCWPIVKDGAVIPRTSFVVPDGPTPVEVRAAALAPVVAGVVVAPVAVLVIVSSPRVLAGASVGFWIWLAKPSRKDLAVAFA
jgi:hypothetical protein